MPYAPGIQDISGQLMAQGIGQAANAYAQKVGSISNAVSGFMQTYQQNQMMTAQAMGKFQGALRSDPALQKYIEDSASEDPNAPKLSPELQKAIDNAKAGKVDLYDSAVLSNFVDTWGSNKQRQMQQQHLQLQGELLRQQAAVEGMKVAQAQQAADYYRSLTAGGGAAPAEQPSPVSAQAAPAESVSVQQGAGVTTAPAGVTSFLGQEPITAANLGQVAQQAGPAAVRMAAAAPAAAVEPGAPTRRDIAMQLFQESGGRIPTDPQVTSAWSKALSEYRKNRIESQEYGSESDAFAAASQMQKSGVLPSGTAPVVKKNSTTGGYYIEGGISAQETPEASAKRMGLETEAKETAQSAVKFLEQVSADARDATADLYRVRRSISLIEQGIPTGPLTPELIKLKSTMLQMGMIDAKEAESITKGEELAARLGEGALRGTQRYLKGGGSVSNAERDRVDVVAENARKNPGTNLELLKTMEAVYMKDLAANEYRMRLRREGKLNSDQIRDAVESWINDKANGIDKFMGRGPAQAGVKELNISSSGLGETKVTPQVGAPAPAASAGFITGGIYRSKKDGKDYEWDGSKMVTPKPKK